MKKPKYCGLCGQKLIYTPWRLLKDFNVYSGKQYRIRSLECKNPDHIEYMRLAYPFELDEMGLI